MNWKTHETQDQEDDALKEILPASLWRVLGRNGIATLKQARQSYPEQLLQMPDIGPITFRKIEELLFPGQYYVPTFGGELDSDALDGRSKYRPFLKRVIVDLKRYDDQSAKDFKA